jgi:FixJ family two-component response regulator
VAHLPSISVVDDDDSIRESLRGLIRSFGFSADVFASAEEFLNSDRLRNTDCLILDVCMPVMTGPELQHHLVVNQLEIPVIFITARGDEKARTRALEEGAVDYLLKPYSEDALLNAIYSALGSYKGESKHHRI